VAVRSCRAPLETRFADRDSNTARRTRGVAYSVINETSERLACRSTIGRRSCRSCDDTAGSRDIVFLPRHELRNKITTRNWNYPRITIAPPGRSQACLRIDVYGSEGGGRANGRRARTDLAVLSFALLVGASAATRIREPRLATARKRRKRRCARCFERRGEIIARRGWVPSSNPFRDKGGRKSTRNPQRGSAKLQAERSGQDPARVCFPRG